MYKTVLLIYWISYLELCFALPAVLDQHAVDESKRSNRDLHPLMTQVKFHPFLRRISEQSSTPQQQDDENQPFSPKLTVVFDDNNSTSSDSPIFVPAVDDRSSVVPAAGATAFDNPNLFLTDTNGRPIDDQFLIFPNSRGSSTPRPAANEPTPPSRGLLPPVIGPLPSSPNGDGPNDGNRASPPFVGQFPSNTDPIGVPEVKIDEGQPNDSLPSNTDVVSPDPTPANKEVTSPSNELLPPRKETFPPSVDLLPPDRDFYFYTYSNWASSTNYSSSFPVVAPISPARDDVNVDKNQSNDFSPSSNFGTNSSLTGALYPFLLPPPVYALDELQNGPLTQSGTKDQITSNSDEVRIVPKKQQSSSTKIKFEPVASNSNLLSVPSPSRIFLPPFGDKGTQEAIVEIRPPNRSRFIESDALPFGNLVPVNQPSQESPLNRIDLASPNVDSDSTSTTEKLVLIPTPRHSSTVGARKDSIVERRPPAFLGGFVPTSNFTEDSSKSLLIDNGTPFARLTKPSGAANTKSAIVQQQRRPNVAVKEQHSPKKDVEVFAPLNPDGAVPQPPQPNPSFPQPPVMYPIDEVFPPAEEMPAYPPYFTVVDQPSQPDQPDQPPYPTMQEEETTSRVAEDNTRATEETTPRTFPTRKLTKPTTPTFGRRYTVPTYSTYAPRFTPFTRHQTPYFTTRYYPGYPPTSKQPKVPAPIWPSYTPRPFGQVNANLVAASPQEAIDSTPRPTIDGVTSQSDIDAKYKLAVVSDYHNYDVKDGTFGFSIGLENGLTAKVRGYKKNGKHVIEGSYSLFANAGEPVNITYVADNEGLDVGRIPQTATSIQDGSVSTTDS